jgi:hypothetical protein
MKHVYSAIGAVNAAKRDLDVVSQVFELRGAQDIFEKVRDLHTELLDFELELERQANAQDNEE